MPLPAASTIGASDLLYAAEPWADMGDARKWANGGYGNLENDFDDVRFINLPRPQLYGFPVNAMLGETQDVHGQADIIVTSPMQDSESRNRQVVMGNVLDGDTRCRILGLQTRFRMPKYGRVSIEACFTHATWMVLPYGNAANPTAYYSLWYGSAQGQTFTEVLGSRRHTRRHGRTSYQTGGVSDAQVEPTPQFANMQAALSTKAGATYLVTGDTDLLIFVALTAPTNTLFSSGYGGGGNDNRVRADILNTSIVARVWKNVRD